MRIAEIYKSIQGEGVLTGTPSVFVRASGCNLRCWFCDTPYASWEPEGTDLSVEEIISQIEEWDIHHVVLTGGEPMLFSEMIPLSQELTARGRLVTFETAGTLYLPVVCHLMSISPKLSNSTPPKSKNKRWHYRHDSDRHKPEVVYQLISEYDYQLKFVVESRKDCKEVEDYLDLLPEVPNHRVYMMPQGTDAEELRESETWLAPYCRKKGYRFCPRRQIEWFGPVRGT